jgi:isoquinoline 1-oxidoreductase beta subunit
MTLAAPALSRRAFVVGSAAAAGGLSLGFHWPDTADAATTPGSPEINAWVVVHPDDRVVIRIARSEMGQGSLTGLAQLVAEELGCDWSRVSTEYPTPGQNRARNNAWGSFSTVGSRAIRESQDYLRRGGAAARMMLVEAAARQWNVAASDCSVDKGVIRHAASNRSLRFGEVAVAAAALAPPTDVKLKAPAEWTVIGQPLPRLDTADKLTGKQVYGLDLRLPGMLNAAILQCPVFEGKLKSFDAAKVMGMPGVRKVVAIDDHAVAVIADTWWRARTALAALPVVWDEGVHAGLDSAAIAATLQEALGSSDKVFVGSSQGDVAAAVAAAPARGGKVVTATYAYPYQSHATMEPMNATALVTAERCEVWAPTQNGEISLSVAAAAAGLPIERCDVHKIHLGGGFGRRSSPQDYVRQAVLVAKEMPGTPVKLIWSREEDQLHGAYHPVTQARLTGVLGADGSLEALHMRIAGQSILASLIPGALQNGKDNAVFQGINAGGAEGALAYAIANLLIDHAMRNPPIRPGFWRGVNLNQNALYLESFMDELAHAAGVDPLDFRRRLMAGKPKHLAVLDAVAERIGWRSAPPPGVHRGLAQVMGFGSYVAAAAEVSVPNGKLKIHRIVAATDCGHAVNPQQIARQVEGSFAYGLSAALYGEMTVKGGRMEQENFDSYEILRLAEMPKVETIVMPSGGFWGGVGEPTIAVAAPAVLNALFAATGKRYREVPLRKVGLV